MSLRLKNFKVLGLSLLIAAVVGAGFVVTDFARGQSGTKLPAGPIAATAVAAETPSKLMAPANWLGHSGRLRAYMETPVALTAAVRETFAVEAPAAPGLHDLGIVAPDGHPFYVVALLPYGENKGSTLGGYRLGSWPQGSSNPNDAPPAGFIEVTPENSRTPVSEHVRLGDCLTHDQAQVSPKYMVLKPRLLDKLELISAALADRGLPSRLHVMSGFRTPQYNEQGVGEKGGRASKSRHMYGDAADVFVDADGNGTMDDLNGDGKVTVADARVLFSIAEGVEADYPELIGGLSPYPANSAHGPFVHVDARGHRARW